MSTPKGAEDVMLVASLFSGRRDMIDIVIGEMETAFGANDWVSPECFFDRTRYYEAEMGWPLYRRFVSFQRLVRPEDIVEIKLKTNEIEKRHLMEGKREVNIDPGYIALEKLILATGKNYTHRVYLSKGVYADLTLVFQRGTFRPLEWTYKDYAAPQVLGYFNGLREKYKQRIRGSKR